MGGLASILSTKPGMSAVNVEASLTTARNRVGWNGIGGTMEIHGLLVELFGRVSEHVPEVVEGLDTEALTTSVESGTNSIAWLVWHLTRVEDHHLAELMGQEQIWITGGWAQRFGVEDDPDNTGYGHTAEEAAAIRPDDPAALVGYHSAVADRTSAHLATLTADDLNQVIDRRWNPPVTVGVRLVSVADDQIQHAGQAALVRGILERR